MALGATLPAVTLGAGEALREDVEEGEGGGEREGDAGALMVRVLLGAAKLVGLPLPLAVAVALALDRALAEGEPLSVAAPEVGAGEEDGRGEREALSSADPERVEVEEREGGALLVACKGVGVAGGVMLKVTDMVGQLEGEAREDGEGREDGVLARLKEGEEDCLGLADGRGVAVGLLGEAEAVAERGGEAVAGADAAGEAEEDRVEEAEREGAGEVEKGALVVPNAVVGARRVVVGESELEGELLGDGRAVALGAMERAPARLNKGEKEWLGLADGRGEAVMLREAKGVMERRGEGVPGLDAAGEAEEDRVEEAEREGAGEVEKGALVVPNAVVGARRVVVGESELEGELLGDGRAVALGAMERAPARLNKGEKEWLGLADGRGEAVMLREAKGVMERRGEGVPGLDAAGEAEEDRVEEAEREGAGEVEKRALVVPNAVVGARRVVLGERELVGELLGDGRAVALGARERAPARLEVGKEDCRELTDGRGVAEELREAKGVMEWREEGVPGLDAAGEAEEDNVEEAEREGAGERVALSSAEPERVELAEAVGGAERTWDLEERRELEGAGEPVPGLDAAGETVVEREEEAEREGGGDREALRMADPERMGVRVGKGGALRAGDREAAGDLVGTVEPVAEADLTEDTEGERVEEEEAEGAERVGGAEAVERGVGGAERMAERDGDGSPEVELVPAGLPLPRVGDGGADTEAVLLPAGLPLPAEGDAGADTDAERELRMEAVGAMPPAPPLPPSPPTALGENV